MQSKQRGASPMTPRKSLLSRTARNFRPIDHFKPPCATPIPACDRHSRSDSLRGPYPQPDRAVPNATSHKGDTEHGSTAVEAPCCRDHRCSDTGSCAHCTSSDEIHRRCGRTGAEIAIPGRDPPDSSSPPFWRIVGAIVAIYLDRPSAGTESISPRALSVRWWERLSC